MHPDIGPGLLESVYEMLLVEYLVEQGLSVARQIAVPISFKRRIIQNAFRADLIVEHRLLIELKSVEQLSRVHGKQVLTYLRLLDLPLGLLTNFGMDLFRDGVRRIANNYGA